jgi:hypothetical protein
MRKRFLSPLMAVLMAVAISASAMAANGNGDLTAKAEKMSDGSYSLVVKYESGNNSIKAGFFEVLEPNGTVLFSSAKVTFSSKQGMTTFTFTEDIPAGAILRMTEDKSNKPVVVTGTFEGYHIHRYDKGVETPPTCLDKGFTTYTCECGDSYEDDIVSALGHRLVTRVISEPTCTKEGRTTTFCNRANCDYKVDVYTPAFGHTPGEYTETAAPTCISVGAWEIRCVVCDCLLDSGEIDMLPHTPGEPIETSPSTCTGAGSWEIRCVDCGFLLDSGEVDMLDHNPGEYTETVAPTCISVGTWEIRCVDCGFLMGSGEVPALGHVDGEYTVIFEPTCEETGVWEIRCKICNDVLETGDVDPLDHDYDYDNGEVTDPTCTTDGFTTYTCSRDDCGKTCTGDVVPATGHTKGKGVVTKEPTHTQPGVKTYYCTVCDVPVRSKVIDELGHVEVELVSVTNTTPTYTGSGVNRVGSTTVTLKFTLSGSDVDPEASTVTKAESFSGVNATDTRDVYYTIGCYDVTVTITVTVEGKNNQINITGASAAIIGSTLVDDDGTDEE